MTTPLRIPAVLAFTVLGAAVAASTGSCGDNKPNVDARTEAGTCVYCVYETADNGNCPFPTCATGDRHDVCPEGCIPQPAG